MSKPPKPKAVNYDLIPDDNAAYVLLNKARNTWHEDIYGAKIALAYRKALKQDKDGHLMLGRCVKIGDLQKEFTPYDFVIVINKEVWQAIGFDEARKLALLDHELCHATLSLDKEFQRKNDEKGRTVYRLRKHDIEEFRSVVEHHGCYKADLQKFAEALLKKRDTPLLLQKMEEATAAESSVEEKARTRKTKKSGLPPIVVTITKKDEPGPEDARGIR